MSATPNDESQVAKRRFITSILLLIVIILNFVTQIHNTIKYQAYTTQLERRITKLNSWVDVTTDTLIDLAEVNTLDSLHLLDSPDESKKHLQESLAERRSIVDSALERLHQANDQPTIQREPENPDNTWMTIGL